MCVAGVLRMGGCVTVAPPCRLTPLWLGVAIYWRVGTAGDGRWSVREAYALGRSRTGGGDLRRAAALSHMAGCAARCSSSRSSTRVETRRAHEDRGEMRSARGGALTLIYGYACATPPACCALSNRPILCVWL